MELMRIGIDTSKHVFTLHGVDASGTAVLRRDLRRGAFEVFMAKLAPTDIAIEACGGSGRVTRQPFRSRFFRLGRRPEWHAGAIEEERRARNA